MSRQVAYHFYYIQGAIYYPSSSLQLAWSALTDILPPVLIHRLQNTPQPYSFLQRTVAWLGSSCSWSAPEHNTAGSKILPGTAGGWHFSLLPKTLPSRCSGGEECYRSISALLCELVCVFRAVFFCHTISRKHQTVSSVTSFHRRHIKVQNACSWSEWVLMGLPEYTNKSNREREKSFFLCFSHFPCCQQGPASSALSALLRLLQHLPNFRPATATLSKNCSLSHLHCKDFVYQHGSAKSCWDAEREGTCGSAEPSPCQQQV